MTEAKKTCAVVVPCYKKRLTSDERLSVSRVSGILGKYDKFIVIPDNLSAEELNRKNKNLFKQFSEKKFKNTHFTTTHAYSRFLCTAEFYQAFSEYKHILICQTDAIVISDQLLKWCAMDYDYIGAPWLDCAKSKHAGLSGVVGNGGFSLRKIESFLKVLEIYNTSTDKAKKNNYTRSTPLPTNTLNEDQFWSFRAKKWHPSFKIAPLLEALSFSFEGNPRFCYKENGNKLPFGCHAWQSYDVDFWIRHLDLPLEIKLRFWIQKIKKRIKKFIIMPASSPNREKT